jgi:hypothetical protein
MNKLQFGLIALTVLGGCDRSPVAQPVTSAGGPSGTVTIKIERDGNVQTLEMPEVSQGTTLEAVMRRVTEPPVAMRGTAATAFVESIGDQDTSGSEGWTFLVDGEFATQGVGVTKLNPPTTVTWKYGDFRDQSSDPPTP